MVGVRARSSPGVPAGTGSSVPVEFDLAIKKPADVPNPVEAKLYLDGALEGTTDDSGLLEGLQQAFRSVHGFSWTVISMTLPGFRMFFGSRERFSVFISATSWGLRECPRYALFSSPMPCSAEITPP